MNEQKSLLTHLGEALDQYRARRRAAAPEQLPPGRPRRLRWLLPTPGNVIFTLLVVAGLFWATSAGALPLGRSATLAPAATSTGTIAYQGRLADTNGSPLTGTYNMIFRLYDAASGGVPLWEEQWTGSNGVAVSDGLFNVMLGSLTAIPQSVITGNSNLWLGITVGTDDEMTPRVQLGSVPFAVQALTVPDGSVTTAKIVDGAVTSAKVDIDNGLTVNGGHLSTNQVFSVNQWRNIDLNYSNASGGRDVRFFNTGGANPDGAFVFVKEDWSANPTLMKIETSTGNVSIQGNLSAGGTKAAVVNTVNHGQRKLYAIEAPDVRFSDEGMAHLQNGIARVLLGPVFLETIEGDYLVHVTPYGDASLYVAETGKDYFVVKVHDGDPNVAFAWRLSAHRKGYAGVRLEEVK